MGAPEIERRWPEITRDLWKRADAIFPVRIPRAWGERIDSPQDALGRQSMPHPAEFLDAPGDRADPVGDAAQSPVPWVVCKHPDRALLLVTKRCHLYCRYCFRRHHKPEESSDPSREALDRAIEWCLESGVREVILSGGDPLSLKDEQLLSILRRLRPGIDQLRIHTRAPITYPQRITEALARGLAELRPLWIVVHANHPRELSPAVTEALRALSDAGLPLLNQSVLLRGVNDDPRVLADLSEGLLERGVKPYYLHHTDPAQGNSHLRVPAREGLAIHRALESQVSGMALPRYVVDLADGSGKVPVERAVQHGWLPS